MGINKLKTDYVNNRKLKISDKDICSILLDFIIKTPALIDDVCMSTLLMTPVQQDIYREIEQGKHSIDYIKAHYDFVVPLHEYTFEEIHEIYMDVSAKKETLYTIQDFVAKVEQVKDIDKCLDDFLEKLNNIKMKKNNYVNENDIFFFEEDGKEFLSAHEYVNQESIPIGIPYFDNSDKKFCYPESLGGILMKTGSGKSQLLLNCARALLNHRVKCKTCDGTKKVDDNTKCPDCNDGLVDANLKVLYLHGEMSKSELVSRFLPMITNGIIVYDDIKDGNIEKYLKTQPKLYKKYRSRFWECGPREFKGPLTKELIKKYISKLRPDVVLIDYLQQIKGADDFMNPITAPLKQYCNVYGCSIFVALMANEDNVFNLDEDGFCGIKSIAKCKAFSTDLDWLLSSKSYKIDDVHANIFEFRLKKSRQGQSHKDIPKYVLNHKNGDFLPIEMTDFKDCMIENDDINDDNKVDSNNIYDQLDMK